MATSKSNKFPPQIKYIVGNEACERFSYYGMRAILVIFMVQSLLMNEAESKATYHYFISACYLMPLLGAYISDRLLGKYKTIMYLSVVYCLGHLVLALFETQAGLYWGLGLIALGSGGIKPCVSAHVGDQFSESNKHLLEKIFSVFYFSINFGAFFSSLLIPWILPRYGASVAFGIPGILMAIATVCFWMGRNQYVHVPPAAKTGSAGFVPVFFYALVNFNKRKAGESFLEVARAKYSEEEVEAVKAAFSIFKVFITVAVFWALFDQQGSSWVLQAEQMDLNVWGMKFESSQIQALNPIMVMVLIPFFSYVLYPVIEGVGFKLTPLRKMSIGMVIAALSFAVMGMLQVQLDSGIKLSVAWQFIPYLIITASEVMVSITGLEFAYTQAPRSMKSTIMSFWMLTVFFGNILAAYVAQMNVFTGSGEFFFFAGLMFLVSIIFVMSASRYRMRSFIESNSGLVPAPSAS